MNKYLSVLILHINATAKRLVLAAILFGAVATGLFTIGTTRCPGWSFGEVFDAYRIDWILIIYIVVTIVILELDRAPKGSHPMHVTRRAPISYRDFTLMTMIYDIAAMLFAVAFVVAVTRVCLLIFSHFPDQLNTKISLLGDIYSSKFLELVLPAGSVLGKTLLFSMPVTVGTAVAIDTTRSIYESEANIGTSVFTIYMGAFVFLYGSSTIVAFIFPVGFIFLLLKVLVFGGEKYDDTSEEYKAPTL